MPSIRRRSKTARTAAGPSLEPLPVGKLGRRRNDELRTKYDALLRKYRELVTKYEERQADRLGVVKLAFWTLRNRTSAVGLVQRGAVVVANPRWQELERATRLRGWWRQRPDVAGEAPRHHSLRELALAHAAHIESGGPARFSRTFELQGGNQELIISAQFEQPGQPSDGVFVLVHDVTARVRAQRELDAARQASERRERLELLGKLASSIAHDFNNSFFALTLQLERLIRQAEQPALRAQLAGILEVVRGESRRVRQLQDFARRRTGAPTALVDVCRVAREAVELAREHLRHDAERSGVRTEVALALPDTTLVHGDAAELRSVFLNLLLNARDAMPRGGTIAVEVRREPNGVVVDVADQGTGIPPEDLGRIFEPLFTTKSGRGMGLGLSTAAGMMQRLGGRIEASNRPQGGALLRLTFPAAAARAAASRRQGRPVTTARRRILVVDDQLEVLEALRLALKDHHVDVSTHAADALSKRPTRKKYDLVLCDVGLPDLDGFELAQQLRARAPRLPVVLITGFGEEIPRNDPRRRSVVDVLSKPFTLEQLEAAIARATARQPKRR